MRIREAGKLQAAVDILQLLRCRSLRLEAKREAPQFLTTVLTHVIVALSSHVKAVLQTRALVCGKNQALCPEPHPSIIIIVRPQGT